MKLNLGIVYKDNIIINHRSLIKVVFNPIFRYFGFYIGTPYDIKTNKLNGILQIHKCERSKI
jgi:hypothetical protein